MEVIDHKNALIADGYTVLPSAISAEKCETYVALLEEYYKKYSTLYAREDNAWLSSLADKASEKVVYNLHNKDLCWFDLFENRSVLGILDTILKEGTYKNEEPYYLNNISARSPLKGAIGQQLHIDSNLPGVNYPLIINVLWALEDFTLENGATRIVPCSHKWGTYPADGEINPNEIRIIVPRGSAIMFDANLWHGGGENFTGNSRWAVALGYARWFIKPSFDYMKNTPEYIFENMSLSQKSLLGFNLVPPKDEFSRVRRKSALPETPAPYLLP